MEASSSSVSKFDAKKIKWSLTKFQFQFELSLAQLSPSLFSFIAINWPKYSKTWNKAIKDISQTWPPPPISYPDSYSPVKKCIFTNIKISNPQTHQTSLAGSPTLGDTSWARMIIKRESSSIGIYWWEISWDLVSSWDFQHFQIPGEFLSISPHLVGFIKICPDPTPSTRSSLHLVGFTD